MFLPYAHSYVPQLYQGERKQQDVWGPLMRGALVSTRHSRQFSKLDTSCCHLNDLKELSRVQGLNHSLEILAVFTKY